MPAMISWAEAGILKPSEVALFKRAVRMVEAIEEPEPGTFRCHEIARAVGHVLGLQVQDGQYGIVEHSWLWLEEYGDHMPDDPPKILDPYSVGRLPQVQLLDNLWKLPHMKNYRWKTVGESLTDIRKGDIEAILRCIEKSGLQNAPRNGDVDGYSTSRTA